MEIKVLEKTEGCFPKVIENGDWIDLKLAEDVVLKGPHAKMLHKHKKENEVERLRDVVFSSTIAKLGVAMEVPEGYECIVAPRSSTFKRWGVVVSNSFGIIDNSYSGDDDEWKMPLTATKAVTIPKGTSIAQFRIQLSQKATFWQKLKWLLSSKIGLIKVETLANPSRGGFGSTDTTESK